MHFEHHSDSELLDLLGQGRDEVFTEIFNRYWKPLLSVAVNKTGDLDEAEEIVQDIFVSLWKRRYDLVLTSTLNNYLSVAVKYQILKLLSSRNKRLAFEELGLEKQIYLDHSTEHILEFEEFQNQLSQIVSNLPDKCRLVYELSRDSGYSHKQISEEMAISEKTVEAHISKALKAIRQGLARFVLSFVF
jgi:RNA polymerase sigma-70 factor (family 1)